MLTNNAQIVCVHLQPDGLLCVSEFVLFGPKMGLKRKQKIGRSHSFH